MQARCNQHFAVESLTFSNFVKKLFKAFLNRPLTKNDKNTVMQVPWYLVAMSTENLSSSI